MKVRRGQTLAATMIVLVIILMLVGAFFFGGFGGNSLKSPRKDKLGSTTPGLVRLSAKDDVCRNNLDQLRSSIVITSNMGENGYPATIEDTRLGSQFYSCPVGHERYEYDPATGKVHCPHPGHEKY